MTDGDDDLKVRPRHEVRPSDVCILDLINIRKPLANSCLSESQIELLFGLWKQFMFERFKAGENDAKAWSDVEQLYSDSTTIKRKYNVLRLDQNTGVGGGLPALVESEQSWIVNGASPTPFIAYVQKRHDVMEQLQMSFKPKLLHAGMMEAPDLLFVLQRYAFWLQNDDKRNLNILGITDDGSTTGFGLSAEAMVKNLKQNWSKARFHVAVLNEKVHWRAVLIDRLLHTFEYYDPLGHPIDLQNRNSPLVDHVNTLYETTRAFDPEVVTRSMHSVRRGFHKHQTGGAECGMYVILFIHTRVAMQKSFEEFEGTEIKNETCQDLKALFFSLPASTEGRKHNSDFLSKFMAYDVRLAGFNFSRYIEYVRSILTDPGVINSLLSKENAFLQLIKSPGDHATLRVEGMKLQKDILAALPPQFKAFSGVDIWHGMIQEIVQDPLTKYLRQVSNEKSKSGSRTHNTLRKKIALKYYNDLTNWSLTLGSPPEKVEQLNQYSRACIDHYYIQVLLFDADNHKKFEFGMAPTSFLRECMNRQDSVAFGVHYLRELAQFVTDALAIPIQSELMTRFAKKSQIVKPVTTVNMHEIGQIMTRCDDAVARGYALLQSSFREQLTTTTPNTPLTPFAPSMPPAGYDNLSQIVLQNINDMKEGLAQLDLNHPNPWNFPVDAVEFNTSQATVLPQNWNNYSVTHAEKQALLARDDFLVHYYMVALTFLSQLQTQHIHNSEAVKIVLVSLCQFYIASGPSSGQRSILCHLLTNLQSAIQGRFTHLDSLLTHVQTFVDACKLAGPPDARYIQHVVAVQAEYTAKLMRRI